MRKILIFIFPILTLLSIVAVTKVEAYPFIEVEGYVNPFDAVITDNSDGTSTLSEITYTFTVTTTDGDAKMDSLSLEFEGTVFTDVGTISLIDPGDWTVTGILSSSGSTYEFFTAGTLLGEGQTLTFILNNISLYNDALTDPDLWQEGQIWAQSFTAGDTLGGSDGGSTALPVPESGTFLLLGSGLVGLTLYVRRRKVFYLVNPIRKLALFRN